MGLPQCSSFTAPTAVAQEEEQSPTNRKRGDSGFPGSLVEASSGNTLIPTLPTDASIGVSMCVNVVGSP